MFKGIVLPKKDNIKKKQGCTLKKNGYEKVFKRELGFQKKKKGGCTSNVNWFLRRKRKG